MSLADQRVSEFLDALASKSPTPGGGAVAALTGALACGLSEMVLAYSMVKRLEVHHAEIGAARESLARIRAEFVRAGDADAQAYARLNDAMRVKDRTPAQQAEYRSAAEAATRPPLDVLRCASELVDALDHLGDRWNGNLASDWAMAGILAAGAARSAWWNIRMNAGVLAESGADASMVASADVDLARVEVVARRVEERARAAMGA